MLLTLPLSCGRRPVYASSFSSLTFPANLQTVVNWKEWFWRSLKASDLKKREIRECDCYAVVDVILHKPSKELDANDPSSEILMSSIEPLNFFEGPASLLVEFARNVTLNAEHEFSRTIRYDVVRSCWSVS